MKYVDLIDEIAFPEATRKNVRLILPVLVHWAKTNQTNRTYRDLGRAIGKPIFTSIGRPLRFVQYVIEELSNLTGVDIPSLNSLAKNKKTGRPSDGYDCVERGYSDWEEEMQLSSISEADWKATHFGRWDWVLLQLGLEPYRQFTAEEVDAIKHPHFGAGGEGKAHKELKEYICAHPEAIGINEKPIIAEMEHVLPSGDRLDVYFEFEKYHVAVEVKPQTSYDEEFTRGIFQCVKYKAVMNALRRIESAVYDIRVCLVLPKELPETCRKIADELNVKYIECKM